MMLPFRKGTLASLALLTPSGVLLLLLFLSPRPALTYPPAVGTTGQARNCIACHVDNGPWKVDGKTIVDILDKADGKSLKQEDGTFLIAARRGERKTVLTVIGRTSDDKAPQPYRNAWLYVDPERIRDASSLRKFAPGWDVDLPMSCRLAGDKSGKYPGAHVTVLPMTVRPGDDARDAEIELQAMLTRGESVKGDAQKGLIANYFVRKVRLQVVHE